MRTIAESLMPVAGAVPRADVAGILPPCGIAASVVLALASILVAGCTAALPTYRSGGIPRQAGGAAELVSSNEGGALRASPGKGASLADSESPSSETRRATASGSDSEKSASWPKLRSPFSRSKPIPLPRTDGEDAESESTSKPFDEPAGF